MTEEIDSPAGTAPRLLSGGPEGAAPSDASPTRTVHGWHRRLGRAAAELFEFEAEQGRVRLDGVRPLASWLAILGLSTVALLAGALFFLSAFHHGQLVKIPSTPVSIFSVTEAVTLVVLGVGWGLVLYGTGISSRPMLIAGGLLFLLSNGLLVVNLPPVVPGAVSALFDVAKVALVGAPAGLWLLAALPRAAPRVAVSVLRSLAAGFSVVFFASLLAAERAGAGISLVRLGIGSGVLQELSTLVLLLAPLLYLTGMAVLSLTYALGAVSSEVVGGLRRWAGWAVVIGLAGGEVWFFGWRYRSSLWPGSHGWVVLLHVLPAVTGMAAIVWFGRETLWSKPAPVHDSGSALAALLVATPAIVAGLYFALWTASTIGFLHVPLSVSSAIETSREHVVNVVLAPGPRCVLFATVTVTSVVAMRHPRSTLRQRQLAIGMALMSGWVFWTTFISWLPGTDTADDAAFELCALVAVVVYLAVAWRRQRSELRLAPAVGTLVVIWAFDADAGFLRSLSHLVPVEGAIVFVVGVGLILLGRSQFTSRASRALPRDARVVLWVGYLVLALTLTYWVRGVSGFATVTAHNSEISVLTFIGIPYLVWLVVSGRFAGTKLIAEEPAGSAGPAEAAAEGPATLETTPPPVPPADAGGPRAGRRSRWRPLIAGAVCAALLTGCAAAANAIDRSAIPEPVPIAQGIGVLVPDHWALSEKPPLAVLTRRHPWTLLVVVVGDASTTSPAQELERLLAAQRFLVGARPTDVTTFGLGSTGPFSTVALARFDATYLSRSVKGDAFALLNPGTRRLAFGVVVAYSHRDLAAESAEIAAMELSLDTPGGSTPLW